MSARATLTAAHALGITVSVDGNDLVLRGYAKIPAVMRDELKGYKPAIIALLSPSRSPSAPREIDCVLAAPSTTKAAEVRLRSSNWRDPDKLPQSGDTCRECKCIRWSVRTNGPALGWHCAACFEPSAGARRFDRLTMAPPITHAHGKAPTEHETLLKARQTAPAEIRLKAGEQA